MNAKSFVLYLAMLLPVVSCINEPLAEGGGSGDGTPTNVTLSIRGGSFPVGELPGEEFASYTLPTGRALSEEKEAVISQLHLLVFNSSGEAVLNERFKNLTATDGIYKLQTEMLPGNGMQFYVIANADVANLFTENLSTLLNSVTRLNELEPLIATLQADNNGLNRTDRLLMAGSATINVTKPHRNAIPLTLNYLCAKVTVTLTDNTSNQLDIDITGWDMVNIPRKSYLLQQNGVDAVTGTQPENYLTTASKFSFESGSKQTKTWSQTCYLLENRRGGRVGRPDPTNPADKYPGMGVTDNDQRGKAWYAPAGATYLLVYGTHTQNGQINNIFYKIYLGGNAVNDYNLERGKHYKYNVTINGLSNINVDTNVEWGPASFTVDKSDNLTMDAHPDCRVLRIGGTAVDASTPAYATVEVVGGSNWLALSPLNLYRHAVKQTGNAGEHQQFGPTDGVGSFVRSRYTAVPTASAEWKDATFGMSRQLTGIPFAQPAVCTYQDILIYADAHTGSGERTGQVRITYYKGTNGNEVAGQQTLTVTQNDAIQVSAGLYAERYEESGMLLHPALASELQRTSFMQWGYNTAQLYSGGDRFCNGSYLTANAVYNAVDPRSGMNAPQWTATTADAYRPKYPRTGEEISEPGDVATSGSPYYYPDLTQSTLATAYFHPIYNSSAARYCHEKNRDTNGDGIIDASETVWYLPSYADMVAIKKNPPTTQPLIGTYWTSTEEGADKCWAFTFPAGTMQAVDKKITNRVRCVRGAGTTIPETTIESAESDKTKINLSAYAGSSSPFKITDDKDFNFPWTVTSSAPAWLQITTDAGGTAPAATKTGTGDATLYAYAMTNNNSGGKPRTTTVTLTSQASSATSKTIEVTQQYSTIAKGEKSNCYIVSPGNGVSIPVERANESFLQIGGTTTQITSTTGWSASLIWESEKGLISLTETTGKGASGRFIVNALNRSIQGNAVVAIRKNGSNEILWSWHIWVTDYDGSTTLSNHNGKRTFVFMDRALGATSATPGTLSSCGLYYQWGRKDPFPGLGQSGGSWTITGANDPIRVYNGQGTLFEITKSPVPSNATPNNLTNATRNPGTFYYSGSDYYDWFIYLKSGSQNNDLWGNGNAASATPASKSVFDPCPEGWRIPPVVEDTSPFQGLGNCSWGNYGQNLEVTGGYFPALGYRIRTGGIINDAGKLGRYWLGSASSPYGGNISFDTNSKSFEVKEFADRAHGFTVRCCKDNP